MSLTSLSVSELCALLEKKEVKAEESVLSFFEKIREQEKKILNRMLDLRARRYVDAYLIGEVYAGLGEKEKAFEWLNKAYEERAGQMIFIKVDPWIENLRSDPRYKELLKKTGFEK